MSTDLLPPAIADATETAPTSGDNETNSADMHPGANYFFGFLITFVVLLLVFIGCGLGSRRRMARRRAMFLGDAGPWAGLRPDINQKEPVLWEPTLLKGGDTWSSIMPLSTNVLRPSGVKEITTPTTPARRSFSAFSVSSWISTSRSASSNKIVPEDVEREMPPEPTELQVAVIIALPSNKGPTSEGAAVGPSECQFGVLHIPWEGGQPNPPVS